MGCFTETRILDAKKFSLKEIAKKASKALCASKTIIYPTETCYGIGADALNEEAILRVHEAKKQDYSKPVSVIVPDILSAEKIGVIDSSARKLAGKFMPGPLTLVVKKKKGTLDALSRETIAFRISSNPIAAAIAGEFDSPITATSANIHGEPEIYDAREAIEKFSGRVDLIIDAGILPKNTPSTIYDTTRKIVVREGKIKAKEIEEALAGDVCK